MLYCKFPGKCVSEKIVKISQYLTKLCVDDVGLLFLSHPVHGTNPFVGDNDSLCAILCKQFAEEHLQQNIETRHNVNCGARFLAILLFQLMNLVRINLSPTF